MSFYYDPCFFIQYMSGIFMLRDFDAVALFYITNSQSIAEK